MSAYQASSKTLTFWVVAIVFFVSAVVGQAQTPQALSAASYVARGVDWYKKGEVDRAMADLGLRPVPEAGRGPEGNVREKH